LAAAARAAIGHALPWPPTPEQIANLLAASGQPAQARAQRRLAERARIEGRRVRLALQDARRRLDDLFEEAEEDPLAGAASAAAEAEAWVARHGLPRAWFTEEAARLGLELPPPAPPAQDARARTPREPSASPEDAPYRAAVAAVWGEDAVWLGRRSAPSGSDSDLELVLTRAPRPDELTHLEELLAGALARRVRILRSRSLGGGRRRLRLGWGPAEVPPKPEPAAAPRPSLRARPGQTALLAELSRLEPERHARRDFLLGASPIGEPVFLRQLLDLRGRADLACWAGPWEERTQVALALGERALARGLSAGVLLRQTLRPLEGDGGGSPRWAEGACQGPPQAVLRALRTWVEAGGLS